MSTSTDWQESTLLDLTHDVVAAFLSIVESVPVGRRFTVNDVRDRLDAADVPAAARGVLFSLACRRELIEPVRLTAWGHTTDVYVPVDRLERAPRERPPVPPSGACPGRPGGRVMTGPTTTSTPPRPPLGHDVLCRSCGRPIVLVRVRPNAPVRGRRTRIPLDPVFDPATSPIPASHALASGRWECRPITADDPIAPHEHPALTHFATCPDRQRTTDGDDAA